MRSLSSLYPSSTSKFRFLLFYMKVRFIYPTKIKKKFGIFKDNRFKRCSHEIWILIFDLRLLIRMIHLVSSRFRYWKVGNISSATRPFFSESRSSLVVLHDHWLYLERYSEQPKVSTFLEQSQCIYHLHRSSFFLLRLHKTDRAIFHLVECLSVCMVLSSSSSSSSSSFSSSFYLLAFFLFRLFLFLLHFFIYELFLQVSLFIRMFPFLDIQSFFESLFCSNYYIDLKPIKNEKWFIIHIYIIPINRYLSNISNFAFCQQQQKKFKILKFFIEFY